jgi:hypothetical protein
MIQQSGRDGSIGIQLQLLSDTDPAEFEGVFQERWRTGSVRGLEWVGPTLLAGVVMLRSLSATIKQWACERQHPCGWTYYPGADPPILEQTELPAGTLLVVQPDGETERHSLCGQDLDLSELLRAVQK